MALQCVTVTYLKRTFLHSRLIASLRSQIGDEEKKKCLASLPHSNIFDSLNRLQLFAYSSKCVSLKSLVIRLKQLSMV